MNRLTAELHAAVGSAERAIAAFRGPRGRVELQGAGYRQSLAALAQAAEAMPLASHGAAAPEFALILNP